ncbi:MAG: reverse gyrase [Thermotoga caldifontis]|uniref:reverse gyrase n=1 Tax=Thermotoga caldifontis TaxID=1508419 RepID=UPI003C7BFB6D
MPLAVYDALCPNCGGRIEAERLQEGLACEKCLPEIEKGDLCELLKEKKFYSFVCELAEKERQFAEFFEERVGNPPWSLQRLWAKRVFQKQSFAIVAPTGVGKTTFGAAMASFLDGKSYILVPTRMLVEQVKNRCESFTNKRVVAYTGKESEKKKIEQGDFDILITTNMFLAQNFDILEDKRFEFIFVDDTDSLLKSGKNVDKVLRLLGFDQSHIELALKNQLESPPENTAVLVVSSATLKPRTNRVVLFRRLLGFDVSPVRISVRNVLDSFVEVEDEKTARAQLLDWIERFGRGGLVYVSSRFGKEGAEELVSWLKEHGVRAVSYEDFDPESFRKGEFEVAVGIALPNNSLVRGLDLPDTIRYAIFFDVPHLTFPLKLENENVQRSLLLALRNFVNDERIEKYLKVLSGRVSLAQRQQIENFLAELLKKNETVEKLKNSEDILIEEREEGLYVSFADAATYLQASGRTSRMFAGGVSRGISLIVHWNERLFKNLKKRLRLFFDDVDFIDAKEVDWQQELKRVDEDRATIVKVLSSKAATQISVKSTLVVVESPNKARTIARFFGTPQMRFVDDVLVWETTTGDRLIAITASLGHVFDLVEDEGIYGVVEKDGEYVPVYTSIKVCEECNEQTTAQTCSKKHTKMKDKLNLVNAFRKLAVQFDEILIATDPDAEGEKIAYDLTMALKPFNGNIRRAEFHEVTKPAFRRAIDAPRTIDLNLVKAQLARRILDRWVGFSLSSKLWRAFKRYDLSAGRVQTPVLGWIIERDELAKQKKAVVRLFAKDEKNNGVWLNLELEDASHVKNLLSKLAGKKIELVESFEEEIHPPLPYNTASLLSELGGRLGCSTLMDILQELFEQGLITYHRTDSFTVSEIGIKLAEQIIFEEFSRELFFPRRNPSAGAHECIRITKRLKPEELRLWIELGRVQLSLPKQAQLVYGAIYRRFLASQMKPVKVLKKKFRLVLGSQTFEWELIDAVLEHGFDLIMPLKTQHTESDVTIVSANVRFVPKVLPFTQGTLTKQMQERGLGRPSTYAKIVQTLLDRGYVVQKGEYLFPTELGVRVFAWLKRHYPAFAAESLTHELEEKSDLIERGEMDYQQLIRSLRNSELFS